MSKFGLMDEGDEITTIGDRIAAFPSIRPREKLDLDAVDAAGAPHGFISREAAVPINGPAVSRRRRAIPSEPTRHLAIRLNSSVYGRFVAFADRYKLTYHDALIRLLDDAAE